MGFCIKCGHALVEGAHFCGNCGVAIGEVHMEPEQRKTVYDGELHKCPNCAERLNSFMSSCPSCGYELRGTRNKSRVDELATKLELAESAEQKISIIRNFYVPNTKEDIYEFVILATSNMNSHNYDYEAWEIKLEQAYQKAMLSFGDAKEFQYINQLYMKAKRHKKLKFFIRTIMGSRLLTCLLLAAFGIIMLTVGSVLGGLSGDKDSPFYMIALIGFFPIVGAFLYAVAGDRDNE